MNSHEHAFDPEAYPSAAELRMAQTLRATFASGGDLSGDLSERILSRIRAAQVAGVATVHPQEPMPMEPATVHPLHAEAGAAAPARSSSAWRGWASLAACLALVLLGIYAYTTRSVRMTEPRTDSVSETADAAASARAQAEAFLTRPTTGRVYPEALEAERKALVLLLAHDPSPEAANLRARLAAYVPPGSQTNPVLKHAPLVPPAELATGAQPSSRLNASVQRALAWLQGAQEKDGHFDCVRHGGIEGQDTATTALGVLVCLGAGHTSKTGMFKHVVANGVDWLADHDQAPDMTQAALRTLVLCEHYGMTTQKGEAAKAAMNDLLARQNAGGGWLESGPNDGRGNRADPTVWALLALKSAKVAGMNPPAEAVQRAVQYLENKEAEGLLKTNEEEVAAGVGLARYFSRAELNDQAVERMAGVAARKLPVWNDEGLGDEVISWYHATLLTFCRGGAAWDRWNAALQTTLLDHQDAAKQPGSWDYREASAPFRSGRVGTTALAALSLEIYYRYLPMAPARPGNARPTEPTPEPKSGEAPQDF